MKGVFFFLLGILGGVLAVVLGLVLVQQGKVEDYEKHQDATYKSTSGLYWLGCEDEKVTEPTSIL